MLRRLLLPFVLVSLAAFPARAQDEPQPQHRHAVSLIGTEKDPLQVATPLFVPERATPTMMF